MLCKILLVGFSRKSITNIFSLAAFMILMIISSDLKATHIIGGEVNFSCLGDNEFEVTLTVYRDCFYADPTAFFDDPAALGVFDANGMLVQGLLLPLMNNDTLTPVLSDSCLFVPDDVCVHTTTYRDTLSLPFKPGGYTIAYQRCCRNQTIVNIVDPLNTGATFTAVISETTLQECNSAPKFNSWPPLFICVNEPINFDHSAVDVDGDSLIYKLCTPYSGGDIINNQPQPPNPPPYENISWLDPTYNESNMMGFGTALTIDSQTGLIEGTPSLKGQYVVGVCLEEYRNGNLISYTRRDFQYNVGDCGVVAAIIGNDDIQCENLNVELINESTNSNEFEWYYGDPAEPGLNSELNSPIYEYADTGRYTITLIAEPNGECADTTTHEIYLKNSTLTVDFNHFVLECLDSVVVSVNNISFDTDLGIESYLWTLNDGQSSNLENPVFVLDRSQEYTLNLEVETIDGCNESTEVNFFANVINGGIQNTFNLCPGDGVNLNQAAYEGPNIIYNWTPTIGLDDSSLPNPYASPSVTTLYTVSITDTVNMCIGSYSILVDIQEPNAIIDLGDEIEICENSVVVSASSAEIVDFEWSDNADFSNIISNESSIEVFADGPENYYLRTLDERGCQFEDEILVKGGELDIEVLNYETLACLNGEISIELKNNDPADIISVNWVPHNSVISGQDELAVTFTTQNLGTNIYTAEIENQYGCTQVETFEILVITDESPSSFGIDQIGCDANEFIFQNNHPNIGYYEWHINDPLNPDLILSGNSVSHIYLEPGTYEVSLVPLDGMPCVLETISQTIIVPESYFETSFSYEILSCGDDIQVRLSENSVAFRDQIITRTWTFANGDSYTGSEIDIAFTSAGDYPFSLELLSQNGCSTSYDGLLSLESDLIMDASFLNSEILACDAKPVELNPAGNPTWNYDWSPTDDLSSPNTFNPIANPTETTTYTVIISNPDNSCSISRSVVVEVPEVPLQSDFEWAYLNCLGVAEIQFTDLSVYSNSEIILWNWEVSNGQNYSEQNPIVNLDIDENVSISLIVQTADGCEISSTQEIQIDLVSLNIEDQMFLCYGEDVELNPGGSTEYSYNWSPVSSLSSGLSASPIASPLETTTYLVTVTDPQTGCVIETELQVEVPSELLEASFEWSYISCDGPAEIQFQNTSTYADAEIETYEWIFSNGFTSNESNPTVILNENETLTIRLNVLTSDGCSASFIEDVEFNIIDFNVEENSIVACNNIPVILNENADPNLTYQWSPIAGLSNPLSASPLANPTATTIYTVTILDPDKGSCEVQQEVEVIVPDAEVNVDFDLSYLECGTSAQIQLMDLSSSNLEIVAWEWFVDGASSYSEQNPVIAIDESGVLNINLQVTTEDGCEYSLPSPLGLPVSLIDLNSFNAETLSICRGEDAILNEDGNSDYSYTWEQGTGINDVNAISPLVNPLETTTYNVTISNISIDTCSIESTVTVMVYEEPNFSIEGEEQICEEDGQLAVVLEPGETIVWSNDANFDNVLSTESNLDITPGDGMTYYAMIQNVFGCGSEIQSIFVESNYFEIGLEEDLTICLGSSIEISAFALDGEQVEDWTWEDHPSIIENLGSSILVSPEETTTYSVFANNAEDCVSAAQSIHVEVIDLEAELILTSDENSIDFGESVQLNINEGYSYTWSPSNSLNDANISNPVATPLENTTYTVEVEDEYGCTSILSIAIVVAAPVAIPCEEPYVFIPNAFTPNGDSLNDELKVEGQEISEMHLSIFNRWGEMVFESKDQSYTWDGSYKGKQLDPDVFGYTLRLTCSNGDEFNKQGNISLLK